MTKIRGAASLVRCMARILHLARSYRGEGRIWRNQCDGTGRSGLGPNPADRIRIVTTIRMVIRDVGMSESTSARNGVSVLSAWVAELPVADPKNMRWLQPAQVDVPIRLLFPEVRASETNDRKILHHQPQNGCGG